MKPGDLVVNFDHPRSHGIVIAVATSTVFAQNSIAPPDRVISVLFHGDERPTSRMESSLTRVNN